MRQSFVNELNLTGGQESLKLKILLDEYVDGRNNPLTPHQEIILRQIEERKTLIISRDSISLREINAPCVCAIFSPKYFCSENGYME